MAKLEQVGLFGAAKRFKHVLRNYIRSETHLIALEVAPLIKAHTKLVKNLQKTD